MAPRAALTISDIPFLGPIGAVRVGLVDGQFIINPTYAEMRESLLNIMVVGTADGIVMIESGAKEVKEETVVDAIEFGSHRNQKDLCGDQSVARKSRQTEAGSHPAGIRSRLITTSSKKKIGADLTDRSTPKSTPRAESYNLVSELKKELQGRASRG